MKRYCYALVLSLCCWAVGAQRLHYWFDTLRPQSIESLSLSGVGDERRAEIATGSLEAGLHTLYCYAEVGGHRSALQASLFYKPPKGFGQGGRLQAFFDRIEGNPIAEADINMGEQTINIPTARLQTAGLHTVYLRVANSDGGYSPVASSLFYHTKPKSSTGSQVLRYWFDDRHGEARTLDMGSAEQGKTYTTTFDTKHLESGLHHITIQLQNRQGDLSATQRTLFYKPVGSGASYTAVEYWFDGKADDRRTYQFAQPISGGSEATIELDKSGLERGSHTLHCVPISSDGKRGAESTITFVEEEGTASNESVITLTTTKQIGKKIRLAIVSDRAVHIEGVQEEYQPSSNAQAFTLTSQTIKIFGAVTEFACPGAQLTNLDVSKSSSLQRLMCSDNQLKSLDVSKHIDLRILDSERNQLTTLDLKKNVALQELRCSSNQLSSLDISKNVALQELDCHSNGLTSLDVSKNQQLKNIVIFGNKIGFEAMTSLVNQLPRLDVSGLGEKEGLFLVVDRSNPQEGNRLSVASARLARSKGWKVLDYNNGNITYHRGEDEVDWSTMPVMTLTTRKQVGDKIRLGIVANGPVHIEGVQEAYQPSSNWRADKLYTLTSQTVKIFGAVTQFDCVGSQVRSLDVSKNPSLQWLDCSINQLKELDVSNNTALVLFHCMSNQLTSLDVSSNTSLQELHCYLNELTSLAVSGNGQLKRLYIYSNRIGYEAMEALVNQLPSLDLSRLVGDDGSFIVVDKKDTREGNRLSVASAELAKRKSWKIYNNNEGNITPYEGADDPNWSKIPVMILKTRKHIWEKIGLGIVAKGDVRIEGVEEVYQPNRGRSGTKYTLTSQTIKIFGEVSQFDCVNGGLTSLDVSKNVGLEELYCHSNELIALDVRENVRLRGLYCHSNQLTSLDVSKNVGLREFYCHANRLTSLDVSKNASLQVLSCFSNRLTSLDVSKNAGLQRIDCRDNQLMSLDVSWNYELKRLQISGNKIGLESMATLVSQLPTLDVNSLGEVDGYFIAVDRKSPRDGNHLSVASARLAKRKGWKVYDYNNGKDANDDQNWIGIPYEGEDEPVVEQVDERYVITLTTSKQSGEVLTLRIKTDTPVRIEGLPRLVAPRSGVWQSVEVPVTTPTIRVFGRLQGLDCKEERLGLVTIKPVKPISRGTSLRSRATSGAEAHSIEWLDCSHNALTSLDLTSATNLSHLDASYNALSAVEIPEGNSLSHVEVQVNRLGKEAMASIVSRLPDQADALIIVVDKTNPREGNHIDRQAVGTAKRKGWQINDANNQTDEGGNPSDTGIPYEGESSVYAVTLEQSEGGLITIEGKTQQELQAIEEGTELSVIASPEQGYELSTLTANGSDITAMKRFTLDGNTTVRATFRKRTYSVTTNTPEHGAIRITGASDLQAVPYGTQLRIEATPEQGYELAALTANGTDISTTRQFVVTSDTRVEATFREKPVVVKKYAVTLESTDGGKIRIKGKTAEELKAVEEGTELSVSIAREEGYTLASLTANGVDIMDTKKFVVTSDTRVVATFEKRTFAIKLPEVEHATIQVKGNPDLSKVVYGTELELEITPEEGYEVAEVKVNGKTLTPPYRFRVDGTPVIVVKMKRSTYHVLQFVEGKGALSITGASDLQAVPYGTQLNVTATPEQGYELAALTANGTDISTTRQFVVTSDTRVEATFREKPVVVKKYAVTLESTDGGKIRIKGKTAEELQAIEEGTELSVSIAREEGYTLASLTANGVDIMDTKKFVVTSDTRVVATFEKRTFAIKLPEVEHATVRVKGNPDLSKVTYGDELELEITPDEEYVVEEVKVNGKTLTAPYRFRVEGEVTISIKMRKTNAVSEVGQVSIRLYPNPATSYIVVEGVEEGEPLRLINLVGRVVLEQAQSASGRLGVSHLDRGVYLLQVQGTTHRVVLR